MTKAKLFVLGTERELLWTDLEYHRYLNHKTGRCGETPMGGLITLVFASGYDDERLLRWMTHSEKDEFCTLTACKIIFYEGDFDGPSLFEYKYNDAALVYWKETFNAVGEGPMTVTMTISAAIQEVKWQTLIKSWQESWIPPSEQMPYQAKVNEQEYDEQIKVFDKNKKPIVNLPYCIEFDNKIIYSGKTDKNGLTLRLKQKENKDKYSFYWGDEALLKTDKA